MRSTKTISAKARLFGARLAMTLLIGAGVAAPTLAQERIEQDLGVVQACGADVWRLCWMSCRTSGA